jgi:hypothetical protein
MSFASKARAKVRKKSSYTKKGLGFTCGFKVKFTSICCHIFFNT